MLEQVLKNTIRKGQIRLVMPDGNMPGGKEYSFGSDGPEVVWRINHANVASRLLQNSEFELGETYMEKGWDLLKGSLSDLLYINFHERSQHI